VDASTHIADNYGVVIFLYLEDLYAGTIINLSSSFPTIDILFGRINGTVNTA
jgi:hypothetical protein